ncbi:MAG: UDP-N-acetylmuramate--L-alanine ligase [candidate division WOR-3 bacterium]
MILPKKKYERVHFIGIGGSGMSGIAEVLINLGFTVTGSDVARQETTNHLEELGARVFYGHDPSNPVGADLVVVSSAIRDDNPELVAAREMGIPVVPRARMLAELMRVKFSIAISGMHGKSTTSSMVAHVLARAGLDPTVVIGGRFHGTRTGARLGQGPYLVAEADESDRSFLELFPTIAVVTNLDPEHLDTYSGMEDISEAFLRFVSRVPFYGVAVLNLDSDPVRKLMPLVEHRVITYGMVRQADVSAREITLRDLGSDFLVFWDGEEIMKVSLSVPGIHNVSNALAAIAVALELEIPHDAITEGLASFSGVERRFEIKGERDRVRVVDDYGHHPTEIRATLAAARNYWKDGRIVVLFQPHRFTRTLYLHAEFGGAFLDSDLLFILPIYPAGEKPIEGVSSRLIYEAVKEAGHKDVHLIEEGEDVLEVLREALRPGDLLLTLGAGNVWKIGEEFLNG